MFSDDVNVLLRYAMVLEVLDYLPRVLDIRRQKAESFNLCVLPYKTTPVAISHPMINSAITVPPMIMAFLSAAPSFLISNSLDE